MHESPPSNGCRRHPIAMWACVLAFALVLVPNLVLAASLLDARVGESVDVDGFRYGLAKARIGSTTLERIDVYAPGAQIYAVRREGLEALPKSSLRVFISTRRETVEGLYLLVDVESGRFHGAVFDAVDLVPIEGRTDDGKRLRLAKAKAIPDKVEPFQCSDSLLPDTEIADTVAAGGALGALSLASVQQAGATAVLAIDTDNELLAQKFADNTTAATDYLAALIAGINVIYRRDLGLHLLQGTTFLRPSDVEDPYPSTSANGTSFQLGELSGYWSSNPALTAADGSAVVPRTFVTLISGKSSSNWNSAGIATVLSGSQTNYCQRTGSPGHYNLTRIFKYPGATAARDVSIVAHEIGHNLGASHTHCSDRVTGAGGASTNTIDQCDTASACYTGPVSCPTDLPYGTLMSYCSSPCTKERVFHPAHQIFLSGRIGTNITNGCLAIEDSIFRHGFEAAPAQ